MIDNVTIGSETFPVSEMTRDQRSLVETLEQLGAERLGLHFQLAKVDALAQVIQAKLGELLLVEEAEAEVVAEGSTPD